MEKLLSVLCLAGLIAGCSGGEAGSDLYQYPESPKSENVDVYYGEEVPDPYRWLEDDHSPQTAQWVKAQNELTFSYLKNIPFRDEIEDRLKTLYNYERLYAPVKHGSYYYFYKNDGLQNQNVLYRKKELDAAPEVFLDPNEFSEDGTTSLAGVYFSKDGSLCGYLISEGGADWRKAIIIEAETKQQIGDTLNNIKFSGLAWQGKEGFYYSSYEKPNSGSALSGKTHDHKLYFHKLRTPQREDALIFGEEENPRRYVSGYLTEDERFLVIAAAQNTSGNELYVKDLSKPGDFITIVGNAKKDHYVVTNNGDKLLVHTNYKAAKNRIVEVDLATPGQEHWKDVIPEGDHVLKVNTGGGKLFAEYLVDAKTAIKQYDITGKLEREVELPGIGKVSGFQAKEDEEKLYYTFTSFTTPATIFQYDIESGKSTLYEQPEVDFVPEDYVTKQVFYESKDGTKIPMFIIHKKGLELNGTNPTYLYGYGGFNISLQPNFSTSRIVWLENGGVYAQPSLRGGGEYGESWHKAGTKMQKQNVFDDFIAAAEFLIAQQYTSSKYLAIEGRSNGGLLVGATMTQRPELAKVAFPGVGVLDMLRYHTFTSGAGWASDYGSVEESEEMFRYLHKYSPVHNVKKGVSYPATMITTSDHDDRVVPAHSFKFAANLQEKHEGENPVMIRIEVNAGHGAGTPIAKIIEQEADKHAFAWYNMGINPQLAESGDNDKIAERP